MAGIKENFEKNLDFLLSNTVDNGTVEFEYLQGNKTVKVKIQVVADYGQKNSSTRVLSTYDDWVKMTESIKRSIENDKKT